MADFRHLTHFHHQNIIKYCPESRGHLSSVEEMNEVLIQNWNSVVKDTDAVICLGDFAFANVHKTTEVFNRLKGIKFLIRGNHDSSAVTSQAWKFVGTEEDFYGFKLSHYPHIAYINEQFDGRYRERHVKTGNVVLHGHKHSTSPLKVVDGTFNYDVGVDGNALTPVNFRVIEDIAEREGF